jgi:hypothetical protein
MYSKNEDIVPIVAQQWPLFTQVTDLVAKRDRLIWTGHYVVLRSC